jgi:hypothetical protein
MPSLRIISIMTNNEENVFHSLHAPFNCPRGRAFRREIAATGSPMAGAAKVCHRRQDLIGQRDGAPPQVLILHDSQPVGPWLWRTIHRGMNQTWHEDCLLYCNSAFQGGDLHANPKCFFGNPEF